jgi:acetylornithine aminotransferase
LACAAALAVLEIIESEQLIDRAAAMGSWLMQELQALTPLQQVRGRGLMIGFDVPESLAALRQRLLTEHHIFTGEAKPRVIRLLPSLALQESEANQLIVALKKEFESNPIA